MKTTLSKLMASPDYIGMAWGVIDAITEGDESVEQLCKVWGLSQGTFYRTTDKHQELKEAFKFARRIRAQRYADQAIELTRPATTTLPDGTVRSADWGMDQFGRYTANTGLINRDALRIKTLLHLAAKLDPEQFGDRVIQETVGDQRATLIIGDTKAAAELIKAAREARLAAPEGVDDKARDANARSASPTSSAPAGPPGPAMPVTGKP